MKKKWGVVQLVGHLTVNEDGEGSNPSAPAKFPVLDKSKVSGYPINPYKDRISVADAFSPRRAWRQALVAGFFQVKTESSAGLAALRILNETMLR
jgi:hypothetical protein